MTESHSQLFEAQRSRLFGIAYRMLGSVSDAEDILQDAYLRWQDVNLNDVNSPQAYLASMVTRQCIDRLRQAKVERLLYKGPWLPEPIGEEVSHELSDPEASQSQAEYISMGFLMLLENLPPMERAVFILREAFDLGHDQIASMLDVTTPNSRQLLHRARQRMDQADHDAASRQATGLEPNLRQMLTRFMDAASTGNLEALHELMTDDIVAYTDGGGKVSAAIIPLEGKDRVGTVLSHVISNTAPKVTMDWTIINGAPALVMRDKDGIHSTHSIELKDGKVHRIYSMRNPDKLSFVDPGRLDVEL